MRVLFVVADSLRADALGCYGSKLCTPTIDGLAGAGARFETVISSAPWTVPSLAAMLTGVWSHRLGIMKWEQPWPQEAPTIFSYFRNNGIETASFVFDPGHLFRSCPEAGVVGSSQDTGTMLAWFQKRRNGDYFAFVHYWWTHVPYLRRKLPLTMWNKVSLQILELLSVPDPEQRIANREKVKSLYALAVEEFSEVWLPALLDAARADVVVIVADHGESWGERLPAQQALHDVFDLHGNHLHDEVLRVPWILHAPGIVQPVTVNGQARTVDILPTLVELLDLRKLSHMAPISPSQLASARCCSQGGDRPSQTGISLSSALASGRIDHNQLAFSSRNHDFVDAPVLPKLPGEIYVEFACRDRTTKLISSFDGSNERQYDLTSDPGEDHPSARVDATLTQALRSELSTALVAPYGPEDFSRMCQQLKNLGYL